MNNTNIEIGATGRIVTATRGKDGAGEVQVNIEGGGSEVFLAYSDKPLSRGTVVTVYDIHAGRRVDVESV